MSLALASVLVLVLVLCCGRKALAKLSTKKEDRKRPQSEETRHEGATRQGGRARGTTRDDARRMGEA